VTITALIIPASGSEPIREEEIIDDLPTMKDLVGGWIERVELLGDGTLWLNEEGKIDGLPVNRRATRLAQLYGHPTSDVLVGQVVVVGPPTGGGDNSSVTPRVRRALHQLGYMD
jgi:hypothetical protein